VGAREERSQWLRTTVRAEKLRIHDKQSRRAVHFVQSRDAAGRGAKAGGVAGWSKIEGMMTEEVRRHDASTRPSTGREEGSNETIQMQQPGARIRPLRRQVGRRRRCRLHCKASEYHIDQWHSEATHL